MLTLVRQYYKGVMQAKRPPVPIKLTFPRKHVKSFRSSHLGRQNRLFPPFPQRKKAIDIESVLTKIHNTSLSIYREQISSIKLQKKTEKDFQAQLTFFWSDLLSHLGRPEEEGRTDVSYAVSYIKRQSIVANQIARYRSESEKCMNELARKELEIVKIYSSAKKENRPFASLPK